VVDRLELSRRRPEDGTGRAPFSSLFPLSRLLRFFDGSGGRHTPVFLPFKKITVFFLNFATHTGTETQQKMPSKGSKLLTKRGYKQKSERREEEYGPPWK
jgi:hypothetical protein